MSGCYWERLGGLGGTLAEILANDFQGFAGRVIVDVNATDTAFKFTAACGTFKSYTAPSTPASSIVPGAHVVGAHRERNLCGERGLGVLLGTSKVVRRRVLFDHCQ